MSKRNINAFARWYFPKIKINFTEAGEILGTSNIDEMIDFVMIEIRKIASERKELKKKVNLSSKSNDMVKLVADEIEALISAKQVAIQNRMSLFSLLKKIKTSTKKDKPLLPICRGSNHFKIGDDIMIDIGLYYREFSPVAKISKHDWIPAKILSIFPHTVCYTIKSYVGTGAYCGHYFAAPDQNYVFKRQDFYELRRIVRKSRDVKFLKLLPKYVRDSISNGTVYPMSDKRLAKEQTRIIKTAYNVFDENDCYRDNVKIMAKKRRIKLDK
jgi:hypothetical protein